LIEFTFQVAIRTYGTVPTASARDAAAAQGGSAERDDAGRRGGLRRREPVARLRAPGVRDDGRRVGRQRPRLGGRGDGESGEDGGGEEAMRHAATLSGPARAEHRQRS
jgi:hypothetical protein